MTTLNERMNIYSDDGLLAELPNYISDNINFKMSLRPYQIEAFRRFITYFEHKTIRRYPTQTLFHMATGSGKTLIMAGLILYLFSKGYRNYIFFVNSTNIIEKTKLNFLDLTSSKYLFSDNIIIDGKRVQIKEVQNFQYCDENAINILFTTTSKLHRDMNPLFVKENMPTIADFEEKKIVLISDESHHLNVDTKGRVKLTGEEYEQKESWETTVTKIFNLNRENVLMEFTATCDIDNTQIKAKYDDKLIFDYPLKKFRIDKYSKEVRVLQIDSSNFERSIIAIALSQYRYKLFQKNGKHIKPVVLFKSKTILESREFYNEFQKKLKVLNGDILNNILSNSEMLSQETILSMAQYFFNNKINLDDLAEEIRQDFNEDHCIIVNNKDESEEKQIAVNTLEDKDNIYRAVFAVDKLNEGWDVLNLFDIIRLYDTRDAKNGQPGNTTISEAQLIGRGARYCPFTLNELQDKFKRKYDDDLHHEMRVCEELYYHSKYNPRYIQELGIALRENGIWSIDEKKPIELKLKDNFRNTELYKKGIVFVNERRKKLESDIISLPEKCRTKLYEVALPTGHISSSNAFEFLNNNSAFNVKDKIYSFTDMGEPVIFKALHRLKTYDFSNLKRFLPNLKSIREFILSENYMGSIKVKVKGIQEDLVRLNAEHRLLIAYSVLKEVEGIVTSINITFEGTEKFIPLMIKDTFKNKLINITDIKDEVGGIGVAQSDLEVNNTLYLNLPQCDWYGYEDNFGTTEEKRLTVFLNSMIDDLYKKYSTVVLLRNERFFKIYSFSDGQPFEPDFILFLQENKTNKDIQYQLFIEPKGKNLIEYESWKETFLEKIETISLTPEILWENKEFRIYGLPFFNHEERMKEFSDAIDKFL